MTDEEKVILERIVNQTLKKNKIVFQRLSEI